MNDQPRTILAVLLEELMDSEAIRLRNAAERCHTLADAASTARDFTQPPVTPDNLPASVAHDFTTTPTPSGRVP